MITIFLDDVIAVRNDCDQKYSILEENIAQTKSNLSNDTQVQYIFSQGRMIRPIDNHKIWKIEGDTYVNPNYFIDVGVNL